MIIFKTEGSHKLGLGHIYRTMALAATLSKQGEEVLFATLSDDTAVNLLISRKFKIHRFSSNEGFFDYIAKNSPKTIVVDHMEVEESYLSAIKKSSNAHVVIFGNTGSANHFADVVINAIIGTNFYNTRSVSEKTIYLEGPKYLFLRSEFENLRNTFQKKESIQNILLMFGGTDQANFSNLVLKRLLNANSNWHFNLILGAGFLYKTDLNTMLSDYSSDRVSIHTNIKNVSELMKCSDFFLTSPGTSLFEALCIGLPSISFYQNESQKKVFRNFFTCRTFTKQLNLDQEIENIYSNYDRYYIALNRLSVGTGRKEILTAITGRK